MIATPHAPNLDESPDSSHLDAFVSYSRRDHAFVLRLVAALEQRGRRVWLDADDIPPGAPWRRELGTAIEAADAFIYGIASLTETAVPPVRDFANSYWATIHGRPPVASPMGLAGARAARARMPDPDSSSAANEAMKATDLYAEGWDLVWPTVRVQIERDHFAEHGGSRDAGGGAC